MEKPKTTCFPTKQAEFCIFYPLQKQKKDVVLEIIFLYFLHRSIVKSPKKSNFRKLSLSDRKGTRMVN